VDLPSQGIIDLLTYLLPGFIAAAILYNLTPSPRPVPFERLVQALIFTILIQVAVFGVRELLMWSGNQLGSLGNWTEETRLTWSVLLAFGFGLLLAYFSYNDKLHATLRKAHITEQTSYSSEWYGAFCQNTRYVVLHLTGERRLYGWPEEWPSTPQHGHFVMAQAEWLDAGKTIPATGVDRILVRAADVEMVEFMNPLPPAVTELQDG